MSIDPEKFCYPQFDSFTYETNVPGIYVIGDITGKPLIKNSINSGYEVMAGLDKLITFEGHVGDANAYDVIIIGAGPAGLSAALEAENRGIKYIVLEQGKIANTIQSLHRGKQIFAVPTDIDARGELWFEAGTKENLIKKWQQQIEEYNMNIRTDMRVTDIKDYGEYFRCITSYGEYFSGRRIILATGRMGNPRKIGAAGENFSKVSFYLTDAGSIRNEPVLVYGAGDRACEAALSLCENNPVTMVTVDHEWTHAKKRYSDEIEKQVHLGRIELIFSTRIEAIGEFDVTLENVVTGEPRKIKNSHVFIMIGTDTSISFLKKIGLKIQKQWSIKRAAVLILSLIFSFLLYSAVFGFFPLANLNNFIKNYRKAVPVKIWPRVPHKNGPPKNNQAPALIEPVHSNAALIDVSKEDRSVTISINYSETGFRLRERVRFAFIITRKIKEAGSIDESMEQAKFNGVVLSQRFMNEGVYHVTVALYESDEFVNQIYNFWNKKGYLGGYPFNEPFFYYSILYSLVVLIFGLRAMRKWYQTGNRDNAIFQIRRYGVLIFTQVFFFTIFPFIIAQSNEWLSFLSPWPLNPDVFISTGEYFKIWGIILLVVFVPLLVLFHGKRYCSFVCSIGALSETLGDLWRTDVPGGKKWMKWEKLGGFVFLLALITTLAAVILGINTAIGGIAAWVYRVIAIILLCNLLALALYPLFGARIWCRFFCPLGYLMGFISRLFSKAKISRFGIKSNNRCILCSECSNNCQMGIDVLEFAKSEDSFSNLETTCIGCGICVSICPVNNLEFIKQRKKVSLYANSPGIKK